MDSDNNLLDALTNAGRFDTLLSAIEAAGLQDMLSGNAEYTVFAPNDAAFAKLDEMLASKNTSLAAMLAEPDKLGEIISYHIVPGKHVANDVMAMESGSMVATELNKPDSEEATMLKITVDGQNVMVNDAKVVATDIMADNGVIHEIDSVLMAPGM